MAADITLSASARANLLSLNETTDLIDRTQRRLATGLKVASPIDDAAAYFSAKALSDRAADFNDRKADIDQAISSLKTATEAIEAIDSIVKQMKGLLLSAKSATDSEKVDLQDQFNELAKQINLLANDATYQGLNLVNSTNNTLTVSFSDQADSKLDVDGVNVLASNIISGAGAAATAGIASNLMGSAGADWDSASLTTTDFDAAIAKMDGAITTLRTNAKTLGSNVALLQTRLDFTSNYVNSLEEGADKLTLADLNEEGANFVALQTRQQLSIQALQFAGQTEQSVLLLFR